MSERCSDGCERRSTSNENRRLAVRLTRRPVTAQTSAKTESRALSRRLGTSIGLGVSRNRNVLGPGGRHVSPQPRTLPPSYTLSVTRTTLGRLGLLPALVTGSQLARLSMSDSLYLRSTASRCYVSCCALPRTRTMPAQRVRLSSASLCYLPLPRLPSPLLAIVCWR